ncbi:MAG TPA: hypothetical protein VE959_05595 [Bryobacteraceae bacterium]|nr:hypothetical protein [Bryobacteraceae bacterium]
MLEKIFMLSSLGLAAGILPAADFPNVEISNGQIRAKIYLPDARNGYYRGTRFDWSGVVYSLQYKGHDYYGPWFNKTDPKVHDFVYQGADIVAGPCSAITGPVDEFRPPLGFDEAKSGGAFVKIGVGALRKPDDARYDNYRLYEVADGGKWKIRKGRDQVEFTQELSSPAGYGYVYGKTLRLTKGKPEMVLEHRLKNTGTQAIQTSVYNHNFLVMDRQPAGPGYSITVPFQIQTSRPPNQNLAEIRGNQIVYLKTLEDRDLVTTPLQGFGDSTKDSEIRIESSKLGLGMGISGDRPLLSESLWSIRTVVAMEPYVSIAIEPGREFTWKTTYNYYTLPGAK